MLSSLAWEKFLSLCTCMRFALTKDMKIVCSRDSQWNHLIHTFNNWAQTLRLMFVIFWTGLYIIFTGNHTMQCAELKFIEIICVRNKCVHLHCVNNNYHACKLCCSWELFSGWCLGCISVWYFSGGCGALKWTPQKHLWGSIAHSGEKMHDWTWTRACT